jgi:hypothetical protein
MYVAGQPVQPCKLSAPVTVESLLFLANVQQPAVTADKVEQDLVCGPLPSSGVSWNAPPCKTPNLIGVLLMSHFSGNCHTYLRDAVKCDFLQVV